jgi:hypothetical protein
MLTREINLLFYSVTSLKVCGPQWKILLFPIQSLSQWPCGLRRRSWPFGYCDRGFESRSRHGCFGLCFCVMFSCVGRGLCDGLIIRPRSLTKCLNKITKPPVWGGQGPYKDRRVPDDDDDDDVILYRPWQNICSCIYECSASIRPGFPKLFCPANPFHGNM